MVSNYDVRSHRLRCLGHIINLVVKELLFGNHTIENDADPDNIYSGALYKLQKLSAISESHHNVIICSTVNRQLRLAHHRNLWLLQTTHKVEQYICNDQISITVVGPLRWLCSLCRTGA